MPSNEGEATDGRQLRTANGGPGANRQLLRVHIMLRKHVLRKVSLPLLIFRHNHLHT